ncbi:putative HTH-type transcriptional regulator [Corynebacterium provencense]|uniref:Putative HTH-type transcriptional regulator n=1 Tax=Corynebacterium provencense TaxID=1737425 RepID=A0A2Z3YPA7_9CORY|nr:MarR family transcriptional regulator [Corynebacterium provencense]AWT26346.1 putative HTH-type transcriptional regulator [Corynebacterium provencense]
MTDTAPGPHPHLNPPRRGEDALAADTDARLGSYLKQAEQALMAAKSDALRPLGLTVAQYAAMMALYYVPGQSSAQLARAAAVTPQTMSTILTKLSGKGLISRTPSPLHSKVLVTELTPAGEKLLKEADTKARGIEQRLSDEFSPEEHATLRALLHRATELLREQ